VAIESLRFRWPEQPGPGLLIEALKLDAGEHLFVQGESGSGKSTLLALIAGVLLPQAGTVRLLGQDLAALSGAKRDQLRVDHVGFIFQQFNLLPYLPVLDNVLLPCRFSARRAARATARTGSLRAEAARLMARLDLAESLWTRPAAGLSVGQQQRVAAARALIGAPELLVADEPTSALDAARQEGFLALLREEAQASGAALLFVSHDTRLAAGFGASLRLAPMAEAAA
jgi:putative ABC transport system ATP-binding protein